MNNKDIELVESQIKSFFGRAAIAMPAYSLIQEMGEDNKGKYCYGIFSLAPIVKEVMTENPKYPLELWEGMLFFLPKKKWKSKRYKGWLLEHIILTPIDQIKENSEEIKYE